MNIKQEFEKALNDQWKVLPADTILTVGTFAAKWMAERICQHEGCGPFLAEAIRQLAKALDETPLKIGEVLK